MNEIVDNNFFILKHVNTRFYLRGKDQMLFLCIALVGLS